MAEQVEQVHWAGYLARFHRERAGITEGVLEHARDGDGRTPYDWLAQALSGQAELPRDAAVLDLACGSAPIQPRLAGRRYVGLDLSAAELRRALALGRAVGQADATRLPLPDSSVDAVTMSMALMLVPLQAALTEVARVLRPGGLFVATVPCNRPMPPRDWLRYARLCLALRHPGLRYPNDDQLTEAAALFHQAGLDLQHDEQRSFVCEMVDRNVTEQLLASLYPPDVSPDRLRQGRTVVHRWVGSSISTPIRRFVAQRRNH